MHKLGNKGNCVTVLLMHARSGERLISDGFQIHDVVSIKQGMPQGGFNQLQISLRYRTQIIKLSSYSAP